MQIQIKIFGEKKTFFLQAEKKGFSFKQVDIISKIIFMVANIFII